MIKRTCILSVFFLIFNFSNIFAQFEEFNHPELKWQTIETKHFYVHFHQNEDWAANFIATVAEKIYKPVTSLYNHEPDSKVHLVLKDTDDYANGAAFFYDNKIEVWISPIDFTLRGTEHWLSDLITHEFAHIVSIQKTFKFSRSIPAIYFQDMRYEKEKRDDVLYGFPDRIISFPISGFTIPLWLAEGMAQIQSELEGFDQWDSHRDMIIRTRILNNRLMSLREMESFGKTSIGNESTYNQGFAFTRYLTKRYGNDFLKNVANALSSIFTWTIEKAFKKATGENLRNVYENWKNELNTGYNSKTAIIKNNKEEGVPIITKGISNLYSSWSPDGNKFAYISSKEDYLSLTSLYIYDFNSQKEKLLEPLVSSSLSWFKNGEEILFAKQIKTQNNSHYFDLFKININTGQKTRFTTGKRTLYPSLSPDNKKVAFSTPSGGSRNLALLDIESGEISLLTNFANGEEVFESTWHPDGDRLIFTISKMHGRYLAEYDFKSKKWKKVIDIGIDTRHPQYSKDGKFIYFCSDKTGIFNIYSYETETSKINLLTNVLSGAFMPSIHPQKGLLFSIFTVDGYKISHLKSPKEISPDNAEYNTLKPEESTEISSVQNHEVKPYKNMYTRTTVIPRLFIDYGKPKLGMYIFSNEMLNKYNFLASAAINKDGDYDLYASFEYRGLKPTLLLELYGISRRADDYINELNNDKIKLSVIEADLSIRYPLSRYWMSKLTFIISRYNSYIKSIEKGVKFSAFDWNYFIGREIILNLSYGGFIPTMDDEINPIGRRINFYYKRELNKFLDDFSYNEDWGTIKENYTHYNYNQFELEWDENHRLPFGIKRNTINFSLQAGAIDKNVDDFFYLYAGGLIGLKGYNFYSLGGRKKLIAGLTYRFPISTNLNWGFGPFNIQKVYPSIGLFTGNAWNNDIKNFTDLKNELKNFKKEIDLQLRMDTFFYYIYPMKIGFYAAYAFDRIETYGRPDGKRWKYYFHILFNYF